MIIFYWYINNWNAIATQRTWYKFHSGTYQKSIEACRRVSGVYSWSNPPKYLEKISWTYRGHIRDVSGRIGTYRDVSKLSEYSNTPAGVSGAYRTRIAPVLVLDTSDTGYVGNEPNLNNPGVWWSAFHPYKKCNLISTRDVPNE
jgi:hypothetical protein